MNHRYLHAIDTVKAFFAQNVAIDLYLPDGWSGGRPMENQLDVTFATFRPPSRLIFELDPFLLTFSGEGLGVRRTITTVLDRNGTPAVEVDGFRQLVCDSASRARVYHSSVALFVAGA